MLGWIRLPRRWSSSTLRGRFALWALLSTTVSLTVFAMAAYSIILVDELSEPSELTPAQIDWETGREVLTAMAVALPLSLLFAAGGSLWLARRALAPIDDIVREAREITTHDLERRLPIPPGDDELRALVLAQNALLARVEHGFTALSHFTSDASHELRTPLAVIGSELEIALRRPRTPEEWRGAAQRSLDELQRLNRLIEALLKLARADTASPMEEGRVGVRSLLAELFSELAPEARSRRVELRLLDDALAEEIWVHGSAEELSIALAKLLSNALRYTPKGGWVSATVEPRGAPRVAIHIDDAGQGVDPEEAATIFEAFARGRQGHEADSREGGAKRGLGLGLSIAKRIVDRHGGAISVCRSDGGGARFTIELPARAEPGE